MRYYPPLLQTIKTRLGTRLLGAEIAGCVNYHPTHPQLPSLGTRLFEVEVVVVRYYPPLLLQRIITRLGTDFKLRWWWWSTTPPHPSFLLKYDKIKLWAWLGIWHLEIEIVGCVDHPFHTASGHGIPPLQSHAILTQPPHLISALKCGSNIIHTCMVISYWPPPPIFL